MRKPRFHSRQIGNYRRWEIIGPDGLPLYDNAPNGKDKPRVWSDEDEVAEAVERMNVFAPEGDEA